MVLLSIQNICFNWWIKNNHNHNITLKTFALKLDLWFDTLQGRSQNAESYMHIKDRLPDQAVILFSYIPFQNGTFP